MNEFLTIKEAPNHFGVSPQTLRRWEKQGKLIPAKRTQGGQRRYDITQLLFSKKEKVGVQDLPTLAYARVSSHKQKEVYKDR